MSKVKFVDMRKAMPVKNIAVGDIVESSKGIFLRTTADWTNTDAYVCLVSYVGAINRGFRYSGDNELMAGILHPIDIAIIAEDENAVDM